MAREPKTVIAVDLGSSNVRVVAAQAEPGAEIQVFALGQAPSLGIRRGLVANIDEASYAIRTALGEAGFDRRGRETEVYIGIGGKHVTSMNNTGVTQVARGDGIVTEKDVARAIAAAREIELSEDLTLLHHVPRGFLIDGYRCRRNPVGMKGLTAHAETHLVMASAAEVKNARKAVEMAGVAANYVVANAIASSLAVLRRDEREMGVIVLDIGAGATEIVTYQEGSVCHTSALPLGGNQIANDIGVALNTASHVGERLLLEHGTATADGINLQEELTAPCFGMSGYRRFRRQYLFEVIRLRVTELLQLAVARARQAVPTLPATTTLVITGGVANLPGIATLAERTLKMPARVGLPPHQRYAPETFRNPCFASVLGSLLVAVDPLFAPIREERAGRTNGFRVWHQIDLLRS